MPRKQHLVRLSRDDRRTVRRLAQTGHRPARVIQRAHIILLADTGSDGPHLTDQEIAQALGVSSRTVARVRAAWVDQGLDCLARKPQQVPSRTPTFTDAQLLEVAALACTDPPSGHAHWSLRLLTARVLELQIVPTVCRETVRRALKKTTSTPGGLPAS